SRFRMVLLLSKTNRPAARLRRALVFTLGLSAAGCAAGTAMRQGREAELRQDYDQAVVQFTKAVRLNPNDASARTGLERAKLRASEFHFSRGRRLAAT